MDIEHVAGPLWRAYSESSDATYVVDMEIPKCTCTSWIFGINKQKKAGVTNPTFACKHIKAVESGDANKIMTQERMDSEERSRVKAKKAEILSKFEDREPSAQELALRAMMEPPKKKARAKK